MDSTLQLPYKKCQHPLLPIYELWYWRLFRYFAIFTRLLAPGVLRHYTEQHNGPG